MNITDQLENMAAVWGAPQYFFVPPLSLLGLWKATKMWSRQYATTAYALDINVSRPCVILDSILLILYYSMFVTFMLQKFVARSERIKGEAAWAYFTVNTLVCKSPIFCYLSVNF
jgi:hypothetical protein